jgi:prepilin-type N-terminal cleavage/methylation domain-containing protein
MDQLIRPLLRARARRRSEGFTLIEVVVAMGILATGLLAVSAAQLYAMRGGRQGRHTTDAAEIAQSQIENFQRMEFDDLAGYQTSRNFGSSTHAMASSLFMARAPIATALSTRRPMAATRGLSSGRRRDTLTRRTPIRAPTTTLRG